MDPLQNALTAIVNPVVHALNTSGDRLVLSMTLPFYGFDLVMSASLIPNVNSLCEPAKHHTGASGTGTGASTGTAATSCIPPPRATGPSHGAGNMPQGPRNNFPRY